MMLVFIRKNKVLVLIKIVYKILIKYVYLKLLQGNDMLFKFVSRRQTYTYTVDLKIVKII